MTDTPDQTGTAPEFTDNFGGDTHGAELNNVAKCPQVKAAEACFEADVDEEAGALLRMAPKRMIEPRSTCLIHFTAAKIVTGLAPLCPPFAITTIELTMTLLQAGAAGLNLRFESDEQGGGQGCIDPLEYWRLWIATFTRALDAAPERTTIKQLERWFHNFADSGMPM